MEGLCVFKRDLFSSAVGALDAWLWMYTRVFDSGGGKVLK